MQGRNGGKFLIIFVFSILDHEVDDYMITRFIHAWLSEMCFDRHASC
jgi:hypothetical protein